MTDKTMDLFSRPPIPHDMEPEAPTERPACERTTSFELDDPRVQQIVGATFLEFYSVDDWMDSKTAPDTFEFDSKSGKFYMTKSKKAHQRLVAAGEVVFSPLEVEKFVPADGTLADFVDAMHGKIYAVKKMFPGTNTKTHEEIR